MSFKTGEDLTLEKIDEIVTESPPRMVKVSDDVKKRRADSDVERKNNMNKTFMETLREVCIHSGRIKTMDEPVSNNDQARGRAKTAKVDDGSASGRLGSSRARGATVRRRK